MRNLEEFAAFKHWFMQVIFTTMLCIEAIMVPVFLFLSWLFRNHALWNMPVMSATFGIMAPSMAMSAWFTYGMIKIYGWPSMGIKRAGEDLLAPAFQQYQKRASRRDTSRKDA